MQVRKTLLSGILASTLALGGAVSFAQDSTPDASVVNGTPVADPVALEDLPIFDVDGNTVGKAKVWQDEENGGVWFSLKSEDGNSLAEGKYGIHVHETGVCDPEEAFATAGGHFNPTDETHGDINADPSHAGDLGNFEVDGEGAFEHEVLAEKLTFDRGAENSLADEDGSAIVIHAGEDDLATDPSGESGDRFACAVLFPPMDGLASPVASPIGSPEATPSN